MNECIFRICQNKEIARDTFRLELAGDTSAITAPGQFVNLELPGFFLRRPISICDWQPGQLLLIYKIMGAGTELLAAMQPGETLSLLVGLGNGYDLSQSGAQPLLVGGGSGVPPLFGLARRLVEQGKQPTVVLGFNSAAEVFFLKEFQRLGCKTFVTTVDGSLGKKGFVTDALPEGSSYFYACGPKPMLRALSEALDIPGELSLEERMGCGFGGCMGCACQTKDGYKRLCKDGPVLKKEEILW